MNSQQELPNMPPKVKPIDGLAGADLIAFADVLRQTIHQGGIVTFHQDSELGVSCVMTLGRSIAIGKGSNLLRALDQAKANYATNVLFGES